jgi:hypothetical protein
MSERRRTLWSRDRLFVDVVLTSTGDLVFEGQDLAPPMKDIDEYEYWITVRAADVPVVVAALGGSPGDGVLDLLVAHGEEIVAQGESHWVTSLGLTPEIATWL